MDNGVAVYLPRELAAEVDQVARDELRSRNNMARVLVAEGLRRREAGAQDDKVESR